MKWSVWRRSFDLVSPRLCGVCNGRLAAAETVLCGTCSAHAPFTAFKDAPFDNEMTRLFWGVFPMEWAVSLFYYEARSETARLFYNLKYNGRQEIGELMGRWMAQQLADKDLFQKIDAIVPVPLSRDRQWQRGYNQSFEIARGVRSVTGLPVWNDVVVRSAFRQSQTQLNRWERRENTDKAFRLRKPRKISGRHLLLIDDVVTTGATISSLATELMKAGNVRFSVLSLGFTKS